MKKSFPKLPTYSFSWRSLQIEPIPHSGERITVGTIVKGNDNALIAARLIPASRMKKLYGSEFALRISDALHLCIESAERHFSDNPLASSWKPVLEGFYLGKLNHSVARDLEDGLLTAALHSSSFSVAMELEKQISGSDKSEIASPEQWRKSIFKAVTNSRADFADFFERTTPIRGSGVPIKFGFLSTNYAAQFEALSDPRSVHSALVRAQGKLWQLDRLRDQKSLFGQKQCELVLRTPLQESASDTAIIMEFTEELRYEASRRDLSLFSTESAERAALHLIEKAA